MPEHDQLDDLLAPLRSPAVGGPPPAEIRRRGERRQRRTRALLATGVAAAVAAVAIPLSLTRGADTRGEAPVATVGLPPRALADVDITAGMRGEVVRRPGFHPGDRDTCAQLLMATGGNAAPAEVATATVEQTEGARRRIVLSYRSVEEATAAIQTFGDAVAGCPGVQLSGADGTSVGYRIDIIPSTDEALEVTAASVGSFVLLESADIIGAGNRTYSAMMEQRSVVTPVLRAATAGGGLVPPIGVGPVTLGMSRADLESLPGVDYTAPAADACRAFRVADPEGEVTGLLADDEVVQLDFSGRSTPEGIGVGDRAFSAYEAYGGSLGEEVLEGSPAPPGMWFDAVYRFHITRDVVDRAEITLPYVAPGICPN